MSSQMKISMLNSVVVTLIQSPKLSRILNSYLHFKTLSILYFLSISSGKFLKPKVFNLNFIPTHLNDKVHRELVKFKIQNV